MNIVVAHPPNIAEIRGKFRIPPGAGIIFAYGDTIYNPDGVPISPYLVAHEQTHQRQQAGDPAAWWSRYLTDLPWRLDQELEAHRAEYRAFCDAGFGRNERRRYLKQVAARLSSRLYGGLISESAASAAIGK